MAYKKMERRIYEPFISEIGPYLYLGNFEAATDENIIRDLSLKKVVSVTDKFTHRPSPQFCEKMGLEQLLFEIPDEAFVDSDNLLTHVIFPKMQESQTRGQRIIVHCRASISRSPSLIITYLMTQGMNFDEALLRVMTTHPLAAPAPEVLKSFLRCINAELPEYYADLCRARRGQEWWRKLVIR